MDTATVVALVSVISSAVVAISVTRMTNRLQREAEHEKYLRERRSEAYIEALAEMERERTWIRAVIKPLHDMSAPEARKYIGSSKRPGSEEGWLVRARISVYGSEPVKELSRKWRQEVSLEYDLKADRGTVGIQELRKLIESANRLYHEMTKVITAELQDPLLMRNISEGK